MGIATATLDLKWYAQRCMDGIRKKQYCFASMCVDTFKYIKYHIVLNTGSDLL